MLSSLLIIKNKCIIVIIMSRREVCLGRPLFIFPCGCYACLITVMLIDIGVRANIHWGGGVKPCFAQMANANRLSGGPARDKKNNNELLQSLFFDGRRVVVPDERLLCYPTRNVSQQTTRC